MSLHEKIKVNSLYTRSINLERDAGNENLISSYIPTARSKSLLKRVSGVLNTEFTPRSFSLIGPYGSGKSSFSVFFSHLMSDPNSKEFELAHNVLTNNKIKESNNIKKHLDGSCGYLQVLISGSPEPLSTRILKGLLSAVSAFWNTQKGRKPALIKTIEAAIDKGVTGKDVSDLFASTQNEINKVSGVKPKGIILAIDELGKFLEYEARHYGANDIFTLQTLAEKASEANSCPLLIFVMLHQSFEQYSKGLGNTLKEEWKKVQGRYEEIPFLESSEQTLKVVSKAINQNLTASELSSIRTNIRGIASTLECDKALPSILQLDDASELFQKCYPLHPITALLLPLLCQKLAQNERTLFSFLGSHEEFGFEDSIKKVGQINEFIDPDIIFDYFVTNQSSVISDNTTHRRWAEVISALERLGGEAPSSAIKLLKLIGLFNIIGSKGQFKPSGNILKTIYPEKEQFEKDISFLVSKSIVTYRGFNDEYRVWQGSDFDLEDEVQNQLSILGNFSLAEQLNSSEILESIVAKKYTIQNGALRYYNPIFTDASLFNELKKVNSDVPRIVFFLAFGADDEQLFFDKYISEIGNKDIIVLTKNSIQLKEAFSEIFALKRIEESSQALKEDPVAKKEFNERYSAAIHLGESLAKNCITKPHEADWFFDSKKLVIASNRGLQSALSGVMNTLYSLSPIFQNELINKDKPSSQAAAGRKQLLSAMLNHSNEENIGLPKDKFPPEKSMYLSLIKEHGLHRKIGDVWKLSRPFNDSSLIPVWDRLDKFVKSAEDNARSFEELSIELQSAPYGVKAGVLPVIFITYYLVMQNDLAWFEEGKFQPGLTIEAIERFIKVPHLFSVQSFKLEGLNANLFESYKTALFDVDFDTKDKTVLDIAKPLARFIGSLEKYTREGKPEKLNGAPLKLLKAFEISKSPHKLLFKLLPEALGIDEEKMRDGDEQTLTNFEKELRQTLRTLKGHYKEMLTEQMKLIAKAFHINSSEQSEIRKDLQGRFSGLVRHSVDTDGTKAFLSRLVDKNSSDNIWLESTLTFLSSKPPKNWQRTDKAKAEVKLSEFSQRILDLELVVREQERLEDQTNEDFDLIMLKSLKNGSSPNQVMIPLYKSQLKAISTIKESVQEALEGQDKEVILAVLADLVDEKLNQ